MICLECVSLLTSRGVNTQLVTEAPLLALVPVDAGPVVGRELEPRGAGAGAACRRRHALVLALQRRARRGGCTEHSHIILANCFGHRIAGL